MAPSPTLCSLTVCEEHAAGKRPGAAVFALVANVEPGPRLAERLKGADWLKDTSLYWPGNGPPDR